VSLKFFLFPKKSSKSSPKKSSPKKRSTKKSSPKKTSPKKRSTKKSLPKKSSPKKNRKSVQLVRERREQTTEEYPVELILETERDILSNLSEAERHKISHETSVIATDITEKYGEINTGEKLEKSMKDTLGKLEKAAKSGNKYQVAKYCFALMALLATASVGTLAAYKHRKHDYIKPVYDGIFNLLKTVKLKTPIEKMLKKLLEYVERTMSPVYHGDTLHQLMN